MVMHDVTTNCMSKTSKTYQMKSKINNEIGKDILLNFKILRNVWQIFTLIKDFKCFEVLNIYSNTRSNGCEGVKFLQVLAQVVVVICNGKSKSSFDFAISELKKFY